MSIAVYDKLKEENTHLYIQAVLKLARFIVLLPKEDEVIDANQVKESTFHIVTKEDVKKPLNQ